MIVQSIFYEMPEREIEKFLASVLAFKVPDGVTLEIRTGDCSSQPLLNSDQIEKLLVPFRSRSLLWTHSFFGCNLGFGGGHNRLWRMGSSEWLLVLNPDGVYPYHLVERLYDLMLKKPDSGLVEARQIPLEHPKEFDINTFETPWASGCCALIRGQVFEELGGYDESFFMYCEDVDFSWRVRARGLKVYFCPETFVYHAKRLAVGGIESTPAEHRFGLLSNLIIRHKYKRTRELKGLLKTLRMSSESMHKEVLSEYFRVAPSIKSATSKEMAVACFMPDGNFASHRWHYRLPHFSSGENC